MKNEAFNNGHKPSTIFGVQQNKTVIIDTIHCSIINHPNVTTTFKELISNPANNFWQ